ncbi:type II toxin-antitoxin system RelE/ParE family toxin [Natronospirillum operosum]|uniref:Type II toxin-antitoxin system RelE/ParE family toxin n=1 Tax=Natronospirillum operosum TaxID=2759953 RepID=A0A4Z0W2G8_9GAMM|nr:type II toxin-antitoxin system RelE/ParE family toxin [Natronospirillum operosum]TGG90596.1 type II toxin-antitoxin system RelE/ParE family toxin [Natronospirillum operosum]
MPEPILSVRFFCTAGGREPVRDFLRDQTAEDRKTIGTDIKAVQFGWPLGMPLVRKMGDDLWEVRSTINDGIVRVLFTVVDSQMVLLHSFVKKDQKTPKKELKTAEQRLKTLRSTS